MLRVAVPLAAVAILVGACGANGATTTVDARARLVIADTAPLRIAGRNFRPGERVKLLITADGARTRSTVASSSGRFVVRLGVVIGPCESVTVQALGSRGSRAMTDLTAPDCTPVDPS